MVIFLSVNAPFSRSYCHHFKLQWLALLSFYALPSGHCGPLVVGTNNTGMVAHFLFQIIREHRKNEEVGKHFVTIESMTSYEVETNLIKTKAKDCSTGSRNLLRLHRALEYIIAFLDSIQVRSFYEKQSS